MDRQKQHMPVDIADALISASSVLSDIVVKLYRIIPT